MKSPITSLRRLLGLGTALAAVGAGSTPAVRAVDVWITTGSKSQLLKQQTDVLFQAGVGGGGTPVSVQTSTSFQTMSGFGAALTDSSAWLLQYELTAAQREKLMRQLFSPTEGIGIGYVRVPLGASDFTASGYYSYNENPVGGTDELQTQFSIAHDQAYMIPQLLEAKALNPDLQLMGSPWSAPGWMKTNGSLIGAGASLKPQWEESYARYLTKAVQAYASAGAPFDTLSLVNEPEHSTNYPTMLMSSTQQARIIKDHLGPMFAAADVDTGILAFDHNWDHPNYPIEVLSDPEANQYVAGSAFHAYAGTVSAQTTVHNAFPDKDIYFTEISGGGWATNFGDNLIWYVQNIFNGSVRNWAKGAMLWNLALDQNSGPHLNGCSNCRGVVTINTADGAVTFNEEFYALGQVTRGVAPNAVRVQSTTYSGGVDTVAYLNPDGSRALVALNPLNSSTTIRVIDAGQHFLYQLPARSLATFRWDDSGADFDNGNFDAGGFQSGGGSLDAWAVFGNAAGNVSAANQVALSGERSLKLFGQTTGAANSSGAAQGITVLPGEFIEASVQALVRSAESLVGTSNSVHMRIQFFSQYGAALGSAAYLGEQSALIADALSPSDAWTIHQLSALAPAGAVEARLVLEFLQPSGESGAVHIDDVAFAAFASPPSPGDFNGDRRVDGVDLALWTGAFGTTAGGDADDDGDSDGEDFLAWQREFAKIATARATNLAVPETTSAPAAWFAAAALTSRVRRRRGSARAAAAGNKR